MNFTLIIDNREKEFCKYFENAKLENLDIGDILIKKEEKIVFIIERKTINDLKASIIDGRFREQKARLLGSGIDKERILYLIEGDIRKNISISSDTLIGSLINTQLRDGLKVYKTIDMSESVMFVKRLMEKLEKEENIFFKNEAPRTYTSTLKVKKKDNLTPSVWFTHILSSIPQVSDKISTEIVNKYPTLDILMKKYTETEENARNNVLADITYSIANNKTRKIGKVVSERIYNFFYGIQKNE